MLQKLTQTPAGAGQSLEVGGRPLTAAHEQIVGILRQRLGQNHGELFATPRVLADGAMAWTTPLSAPAVPAAQLAADERAKLDQRVDRGRIGAGAQRPEQRRQHQQPSGQQPGPAA